MSYVPDRGHIVWISFDPQAGREQAGRRPALVLSPSSYNSKAQLVVLCPSRAKNYPFEVSLPEGLSVHGVALADQVRCLDWQVRRAELACVAPANLVRQVLLRLLRLLNPD